MSIAQTIIYGSTNDLQKLLDHKPNINQLDEYGYTPLIEAIILDDIEKAKMLIDAGAEVNQKDITKRTALNWAISNNNFDICKLLLEHQADPNAYNIASEPALASPILRNEKRLKDLLIEHGASFQFAYDYINTKLIGHRFELVGSVDIPDVNNVFTEVDYEGFYLEFSLDLITHSLQNFLQNYVARSVSSWFDYIQVIANALSQARILTKNDNYLAKPSDQQQAVQSILNIDPLVLPISQEGHAISVVKYGNLLAICDRAADMPPHDIIPIYYMNKPYKLTAELICSIVYQKHRVLDIHNKLKRELVMHQIDEIPLHDQATGNCSWANIEAVIPALKYMLQMNDPANPLNKEHKKADSLELFHRWRNWDANRALQFVIQEFDSASPARKASIAALLAGVLFQKYSAEIPEHVTRAKNIIRILKTKGYEYILKSYIQFYTQMRSTKAGKNLLKLIDIYEKEEI